MYSERRAAELGGLRASWRTAHCMLQGHDVRISGQDCVRGTFTHRHIGWTDTKTGERMFPLHRLEARPATSASSNSPLSEFAVLGFEFGYSLAAPPIRSSSGKRSSATSPTGRR